MLNNQESCIINGGITTHYFKLKKGKRQGDPIFAYLFILVLEAAFWLIKSNKNIKGLNIFNHEFLYTAYTDDTTFFVKDKNSDFKNLNIFHKFSLVSGLSSNTTKCEITGIATCKGVNVALCGMNCLNLMKETVKILGLHFSYNKKLEHEMNFQSHIVKIKSVLRPWHMRNLTIEEKVLVFKTLAISKIVDLSIITTVPHTITNQFNNIQKNFIWNGKNPKIKHSTLSNSYGGLKDVGVFAKVISLQCF